MAYGMERTTQKKAILRKKYQNQLIIPQIEQRNAVSEKGLKRFRAGFDSQASVSSFLTSIVLLVGVSGGLFIVVTVILICKYCHGKGKHLRRDSFGGSGIETLSERTYCALHRYETINSDVFSDPSSCSIDVPTTPRKPLEFRIPEFNQESEEPTETTRLKNDYEQPDYSHQDIKSPSEQYLESVMVFKEQETMSTSSPHAGSTSVAGSGSRRVSFQLTNLPRSSSSGDFKFRRYIEGDFHHLKHSKIGRTIPRQFSIGGAGCAVPGRVYLDNPQVRFSSLDERLTNLSRNHSQYSASFNQGLSQNDFINRPSKESQSLPSASPQHIGSGQSLQQQQQMFLQQQPQPMQNRGERRHTLTKDIPSRHILVIDTRGCSSDKLNSPSPTYKSPRMLKKSQSPTFTYVRDGSKLSPSPPNVKSIRESRSTSPLALSSRDGCATDSPPSPFMPIKDFNNGRTPSPPHKAIKTQVAVEVHQQLQHNADASGNSSTNSEEFHQQLQVRLDRTRSCTGYISPSPSRNLPFSRNKCLQNIVYSSSLENPYPPQRSCYSDSRKVKSYDDYKEDYDVLKITEFSKGPFHSADYEAMAELGSPTGSKVRYNDTGSLEKLHDEDTESICGAQFQPPGSNTLNDEDAGAEGSDANSVAGSGNRKYRALWRLRATLEEEEECSDTIRMEDMTSPDDSPDREHATPNTTSFESNALSDPCTSDHRDSGVQFEVSTKIPNHANLLHPNYENRRQNYRNVMNNMLQRRNQSTSVENSFDSVETDGDISDTSRYEVTTTSFESTTDNTDSTTESQASRLKQMKADSGYKSLESQQQGSKDLHESKSNGHAIDTRREVLRASLDRKDDYNKQVNPIADSTMEPVLIACANSPRDRHGATGAESKHGYVRKFPPNTSHFDRRNGKTASKKRREYSRERQVVHVHESINEPETDSRSDLHSGDSFEDNPHPNKTSLFTRFFKSHSRGHKSQYLVRDYSIDEKTNSIFNEFVRQDIPHSSRDHAGNGRIGVRRSPRMHRHRFQRKHTEPVLLNEDRIGMRNRLAPGMRSASLGSDSSASSARRISPQDSIEEEEDETEETAAASISSGYSFDRYSSFSLQGHRDSSTIKRQLQTLGIHDIPIIKLPEDES